jgi:membrane protein implicated in regulation of membrane protease activity
MIPLAHAGHWAVQLVYFAPVLGFLIWLGVTQIRERRRGRDDPGKTPDVR